MNKSSKCILTLLIVLSLFNSMTFAETNELMQISDAKADQKNVGLSNQEMSAVSSDSSNVPSECEIQIEESIGENVNVFLKVTTNNLQNKEFTVTYPSDKLMVTDLCKFTPQSELEAGEMIGQNLNIFDITDGAFKFKVNKELPAEKFISGIINGFSFEKISPDAAAVKCVMTETGSEVDTEERKRYYNARLDHTGVQGASNWSYMYIPVGEYSLDEYRQFNYYSGSYWTWNSTPNGEVTESGMYGRIRMTGSDDLIPGNLGDAALVFEAPYSGYVAVSVEHLDNDREVFAEAPFDNNIRFGIFKNNESIYPGNGDKWALFGDGEAVRINSIFINVEKGDKLIFRVNKGNDDIVNSWNETTGAGVTNAGDKVSFTPSVNYVWFAEPTVDDFTWEDNESGITITGYSGNSHNITIPREIDGKPVTIIGQQAFMNKQNSGTLTIPDTVKVIEEQAFYQCSRLTGSLVIPDSVTTIEAGAFYRCSGFNGTLTLSDSLTDIGNHAFDSCTALTGDIKIPDGITVILGGTFYNCSGFDGTLTLPDNLTAIGSDAFSGCSNLTGSLVIPDGVTRINQGTFAECSNLNGTFELPDNLTHIGKYAFLNCEKLTGDLVIPDTVTAIDEQAFAGCSGLTGSLVIPSGVTSIGWGTFYNCSGLNGNLVLPDSLTSIGKDAFSGCSNLIGSLVIPNGVTSIGNGAFFECSGLTGSLVIPNEVDSIGEGAFYDCTGFNGTLSLPETITQIGKAAFSGCSGLTGSLMIPTALTTIDEAVFYHCSSLSGSIIIPDNITSIGYDAFNGCSGFAGELYIPESVTEVGTGAFHSCTSITAVTIENGNMIFGDSAFGKCLSMEEFVIEDDNFSLADNVYELGRVFNTGTNDRKITIYGINLPINQQSNIKAFGMDYIDTSAEA